MLNREEALSAIEDYYHETFKDDPKRMGMEKKYRDILESKSDDMIMNIYRAVVGLPPDFDI